MIDFTEDRKQITDLWKSVFKDSEAEIAFFLDNCKHKRCLGYFESGSLVSMLFLVECEYSSLYGKYIYAVCTYPEFRGKGYAGALVNYAKALDTDFLWLIPANDGLFGYYSALGFQTRLYSVGNYKNAVRFNESDEIIEYLYEGSDFERPNGMVYSKTEFPNGSTGLKK